MPTPDMLLAIILMGSLTFYVLFGGADYGGGVWDLLASGPRAQQQRELISDAITPVWEANHVWIILVWVLLFAGFPSAFSEISTALNIPLTALMVGVVMRGSSFIFRAYHTSEYKTQKRWGLIFAIASTITPVCLGVIVGAVSSGRMLFKDGLPVNGFVDSWLGVFPVMVGLFALSLFVFLAAVYLAVEARETALQEDFRRRSLLSGVVVALMALGTFFAARAGAPDIYAGLLRPSLVWIVQGATAFFALAAFAAMWVRKYKVARAAAMLQTGLILWGWGLSQSPFLLRGSMTIQQAAAPPHLLWVLIAALGAGMLLLFPSLWYLMRLFKDNDAHVPLH
jgi:cytochrome bd ubiquinol oxidase subunit II